MIWLKVLNRRIKKVDPDNLYDWGLDFDDELGERVVCLKKLYPDSKKEIILRIEDDYDHCRNYYSNSNLMEMKEKMDKLVEAVGIKEQE